MKTNINYECEICRLRHSAAEAAIACELKGPGPNYPTGLMHGSDDDDFYANMSFAVAQVYVSGHHTDASLWACRDTGVGDSLGDEKCGSGNFFNPTEFDPAWTLKPHWKRLEKWLIEHGIEPMVWKNGAAILLRDASA